MIRDCLADYHDQGIASMVHCFVARLRSAKEAPEAFVDTTESHMQSQFQSVVSCRGGESLCWLVDPPSGRASEDSGTRAVYVCCAGEGMVSCLDYSMHQVQT